MEIILNAKKGNHPSVTRTRKWNYSGITRRTTHFQTHPGNIEGLAMAGNLQ
jgi:hypothetical protein